VHNWNKDRCKGRVNRLPVKVVFNRTRSYLEPLNNRIKIVCKSCLNRYQPCLTKYTRALFVHNHATFESNSYQVIPQARLEPNTHTSQPVHYRVPYFFYIFDHSKYSITLYFFQNNYFLCF